MKISDIRIHSQQDMDQFAWSSFLQNKSVLVSTLVLYGITTAVCCSIRYGFLVDSFSSRGECCIVSVVTMVTTVTVIYGYHWLP